MRPKRQLIQIGAARLLERLDDRSLTPLRGEVLLYRFQKSPHKN